MVGDRLQNRTDQTMNYQLFVFLSNPPQGNGCRMYSNPRQKLVSWNIQSYILLTSVGPSVRGTLFLKNNKKLNSRIINLG